MDMIARRFRTRKDTDGTDKESKSRTVKLLGLGSLGLLSVLANPFVIGAAVGTAALLVQRKPADRERGRTPRTGTPRQT